MKIFKTYISFALIFIAISYSIDLHGLSHAFENDHSKDSPHCELCIINHQKDQTFFALEPNSSEFEIASFPIITVVENVIFHPQISTHSYFFSGQFFNRPPPDTL